MEPWRAIFNGGCAAEFNMAADAFLLEAAETGESSPIIRIYGWDRPSITIGYHQRLERAVDVTVLGDTPVVRRVTGGRALLHDDGELTYAVAGNFLRHSALGATLQESYGAIAEAIVHFYRALGIDVVVSRREDPFARLRPGTLQRGCFASISQYEIIVGGRKIAAGSQRRTQTSFMQHGIVRIAPPRRHGAIIEPDSTPDGTAIPILSGNRQALERQLSKAFSETYGVWLTSGPFLPAEAAAIETRREHFKNLNHYQL